MNKLETIIGSDGAVLFRGLPLARMNGHFVLFNLQKRQLAEIGSFNFDKHVQSLEKSGFFDVDIRLTCGSHRNKLDLALVPTNRCNLKCGYCYLGNRCDKTSDLDAGIAINFVEKMAALTTERDICINFFGGEPTLAEPFIRRIMTHVDSMRRQYPSRNFYPGISTNGTMNDDFLKYLLKSDFYFSFSVDGLPETQDLHRPLKNGGRSSSIVESNLRKIAEKTNKLRSRVTVTNDSVDKMEQGVEYLFNLGSKLIHFEVSNPYHLISESRKDFGIPSSPVYVSNFIKSLESARRLGASIATTSYHKINFPSYHMCEGISGQRFVLSPSGLISYCAEIQYPDHPLAELLKAGEVEYDKKTINLKKDLANGVYLEEYRKVGLESKCETCFCRYTCSNGCPSHNYHTTKSPFRIDKFYCETTKSLVFYLLKRFHEETTANRPSLNGCEEFKIMRLISPREFVLYDERVK